MAAGLFGYLGYDMVRLMEDTLATRPAIPSVFPTPCSYVRQL